MGFATTTDELDGTAIQSIQPIYFTYSKNICACLDSSPSEAANSIKVESVNRDPSFIDQLREDGNLTNFIVFCIAFVCFCVGLVVILCIISKSKPKPRRMSLYSQEYTDLMKVTERKIIKVMADCNEKANEN